MGRPERTPHPLITTFYRRRRPEDWKKRLFRDGRSRERASISITNFSVSGRIRFGPGRKYVTGEREAGERYEGGVKRWWCVSEEGTFDANRISGFFLFLVHCELRLEGGATRAWANSFFPQVPNVVWCKIYTYIRCKIYYNEKKKFLKILTMILWLFYVSRFFYKKSHLKKRLEKIWKNCLKVNRPRGVPDWCWFCSMISNFEDFQRIF